MDDLIFSCVDELLQPETPDCATDYGSRVGMLMFSKTQVETTGNVPSAAEFDIAFTNGELAVIRGLTNGHRTFLSETEIDWHQKEWHDKKYRVDGKVVRMDESVARLCERLNFYDELFFYFVTENNYAFGPYESASNFTLIQLEGKGVPPHIRFNVEYYGNGIDYSRQDNYDDINVTYLMTEDDKHLLTEDGRLIIL